MRTISSEQKRLRAWFRRHGWHTGNTPTGRGVWLESPVENTAGLIYHALDPKSGKKRCFCWERLLSIEVDRFSCSYLTLAIFQRRHWWDNGSKGWVPSEDFEDWPQEPDARINIPSEDIIRLAELVKAVQDDDKLLTGRKADPASRNPFCRWIGVNTGYGEIRRIFGNKKEKREERTKGNDNTGSDR